MILIDKAQVRSLESATIALISRIRLSIHRFHSNPPLEWGSWDIWKTPAPWEEKVLPNLVSYHSDLQLALQAYSAGDIMPITINAASYAGLSKDLDFDMSWMTKQDQIDIQKSIQRVVIIADKIHRLGYESLKSAGRA